ncbi:MAG: glutamine--tRNA ligase/YqeY domain fusion protein [Deltaproteobacteria bacterium]|nr:glutamine--tRNA ligase/YqeY domain fusion protein [Deltaproteobacteria bacterium]
MTEPENRPTNFLRTIIDADIAAGKHGGKVVTRFPPEPNGYLHIGHAKSICLNFGLARDYRGRCHLRFDDTNPVKEDVEYIDSIKEDIRWLGFNWGEHLYHAADYFGQLYDWAEKLIAAGKAYVCDLNADEIRHTRGTFTEPGRDSPFRGRSVEQNLDLFRRMRAGEFDDGAKTLRAKIDMASPNVNMRDPVMYRIRKTSHHRSGDAWCIYPSYDWAHGQSDAIEGITHSICTLEFEDHRPLYEWFLEQLALPHRPTQYEFARLGLNYTVMSKRMLIELVKDGHVRGWDDPRMLTIAGLRRRGVTPEAIRAFCDKVGVARANSTVDMGMLEACVRDVLDPKVRRVMVVHDPLRVVIENVAESAVEETLAPFFPDDPPRMGARNVPFSCIIYIEREDFMEEPPKKFFRLAPGREVRLRWSYVMKCVGVVKDEKTGAIVELRATIDPETRGANPKDGRKIGGAIHWVSAAHAVPVEVRLYDRLFTVPNPAGAKDGTDFKAYLNPASLVTLSGALGESSLKAAVAGERYQFERKGFYFVDPIDAKPGAPVFNRIVSLRDSWAKAAQDAQQPTSGGRRERRGSSNAPR